MAQTSITGSTARSAKVLFAALCVAFAGCSTSPITNTAPYYAATARRANAATTTTLRVIASLPRQSGMTLLVLVPGERGAQATIPLKKGESCILSDLVGLECTVSVNTLAPGTHDLRIVVTAPGTKASVTHVLVNIGDCKANTVRLDLYDRAARIAIASEDPNVERRGDSYFGPFGSGTFNVVALDRRRNTLVGPVAPIFSVTSSNRRIRARFTAPNTLSLSLDGDAPFDRRFRSSIALSTGKTERRFLFETEFTTWPTASPLPSPAPCS